MSELHVQWLKGETDPNLVWLTHESTQTIPPLWLRTRSNALSERDPGTRQRLYNPDYLAPDLRLTDARIEGASLFATFSDGLCTDFSITDLLKELAFSEDIPEAQAWTVRTWDDPQTPFPLHQWSDMAQDSAFLKALHDFIRWGFIQLQGVPCERDSIVQVAKRFGYLRETNFKTPFEVYTRPPNNDLESDDLAYRALALGPHTDNPYRTPVPGIQLLHCLCNETTGGLSTLVDSLSVCAELKAQDPEGYQLLVQTPVRFSYHGRDAELVQICPIIEHDGRGQMIGIHYSPRLSDMPLLDVATTRTFQQACQHLAQLLEEPRYALQWPLHSGDLIMFDNNRVLHGRTAYDPNEGRRQLQGCYIDRDAPRSHYRILRKRLETTS